MSYPQPSSNAAVLGGSDFFRLNTRLVSPGDIYESEQGSHAFAIGPDSDIANVNVFYYDPASPASMNTFQISPDRSFVGTVNSRVTENYQTPSPIPGRVLFAPADLYNPFYRPTALGYSNVNDSISFITPILDVVQYFTPLPSIVPQRIDKTYEIERVEARGNAGNGVGWIVVPAWGRKSGTFLFKNCYTVDLDVTLYGVKLGISANQSVAPSLAFISTTVENTLMALTTQIPGDTTLYTYRMSVSGQYDYFLMRYEAASILGTGFGATTHIILSDDAL